MRRKFERNIDLKVTTIFVCLSITLLVVALFISRIYLNMCLAFALFLMVAFLIVDLLILPDFKYYIKSDEDYIVFELADDDYRRINRNFSITVQTRKYITLDDGITRIKIAYNQYVLQFLKEIRYS